MNKILSNVTQRVYLWWYSIDKVLLLTSLVLLFSGVMFVAMSSPPVAERIGLESFYFVKKQIFFVFCAINLIVFFSTIDINLIKRYALIPIIFIVLMMLATLFVGVNIKGATRWISFGGVSLQPSELLKPFFFIYNAKLLIMFKNRTKSFQYSFCFYLTILFLLVLQPDVGMIVSTSVIWGTQLFVSGLSFIWISFGAVICILGIALAYICFPHVTHRIDSFFDPRGNYQVNKSVEALNNGGFFGTGVGEGVVKQYIPDSHADFIFAVIAEEMGFLISVSLILLFVFIIIRGMLKMINEKNLFIALSCIAILMSIGMQVLINIGVNINLLPAKGMTLPFISYGGSSMLAMSVSIGILLTMTKKKFKNELWQLEQYRMKKK